MVEPVQGSRRTDPEPGRHSKLPNTFSAAAPAQTSGNKMLEGSENSGKQNLTNKKVAKEGISFKSDTKNTKFPVEHTGTTPFSLLHVHICA